MSARAYLAHARVVPVAVIDDASSAAVVARALADGGMRCVEVTLRTAAAWRVIDAMVEGAQSESFDVGVGTVLDPGDVARARDAGARFIVSPGFDADVVAAAHEAGMTVLPGAATASEVMQARRAGCDAVKLFPAGLLGGLAAIEALAAPFTDMAFVPSGGVTAANAPDYLGHPAVPAVSGSWMLPRRAIADRDVAAIAVAAAAAARTAGLA